MSVFLSPVGGAGAQFFDNSGNVLTGGKLYTYAAGTTTPQATYTSSAGSTFHANPIVLDAAGRVPSGGEIWLADSQIYKFVLKDSNDVLLATWDQLTGVNSNFVNYTAETELQTATSGQTVFTLTTMSYQPATGSLTVYVDGVNQYEGESYFETDSTTVTFVSGLHVGAEVKFTTAVQTTGNAVDASVVTYTAPYTGAVLYTVEDKLAQTVSVKDFGAVGDGAADDTDAIANAIAALSDGGTVFFPSGVYLTDTITLPSKITLSGESAQDGWARLSPAVYDYGSVIKLNDGVDASLVVVEGSTQLWGLQDLILDGNKSNQSTFGSHCIETRTAAFRNFGGMITGVKCVNAAGWGGYFTGGPLNISNSFFMSGAVFSNCSDLKAEGVDFDGTDGYHPALVLSRTTTANFVNCFAYGWGEVSTADMQNIAGTINGSNVFTVASGSFLYEDAPVMFSGAVVSGANNIGVYFAHKLTDTTWTFYTRPFGDAAATQVTFSATGAATAFHGGLNCGSALSYVTGVSFDAVRFAGAVADGLLMVESNKNSFSSLQFFNNNLSSTAGAASVSLVSSDENSFTTSQLGESASLGSRLVDYAVSATGTSSNNKFDTSNQYAGVSTTTFVYDTATHAYKSRNIYDGVVGAQDSGVARMNSVTNLQQPLLQFASYTVASDTTIPNATNTTVPIAIRKESGVSESSDVVTFSCAANTVYEISGQLGITGFDASTTYVLVKALGLNAAMGSTEFRVAVPLASTAATTLSVPFNFKMVCTSDVTNTMSVQVFQPASGSTFQVVSDARYSFLTIQKLADLNG